MAYELIPSSFWKFPSFSYFDEEEDLIPSTSTLSGLTISEDANNIYIEATVPGIEPKNVEITFDKGVLWVKAEKKEEEKGKKYYRRATSSFSYRLLVPGQIDQSKEPQAKIKNGVATIAFAKVPEAKPKRIAVKT